MKTKTLLSIVGILTLSAPAMAGDGLQYKIEKTETERAVIYTSLADHNEDGKYDTSVKLVYMKPDKSEIKKGEKIFISKLTRKVDRNLNEKFDHAHTLNMEWSEDGRKIYADAEVRNEETGETKFKIVRKPVTWHPKYPGIVKNEIIDIDLKGDGRPDYFVLVKREPRNPDEPEDDWRLIQTETLIDKRVKGGWDEVIDEKEIEKVKKMLYFVFGDVYMNFIDEKENQKKYKVIE